MACTLLLIYSSRESATATVVAVIIKMIVILLFIFACAGDVDVANYNPFIPSAVDGVYGKYGALGVLKGSSIVFFCYTGFDSVSTAAQEAKNPGRDMPIGIIGSLVISTALYIAVCLVLVGIVPYYEIDVNSPITFATSYVNKNWLSIAIGLSAVLGMVTAIIVTMMAQARIFYTMSRDGLLPRFFGRVHRKFGTPWVSQLIVGCIASLLAAIFPVDLLGSLSGMGTLFGFFLVCIGVMILRIKRPDLPRPFRVPLGPYVIPLFGALFSIALVFTNPPSSLARLFIWLGIGILIYICYGFHNSRINHPEKFIGNDFEQIIREH
ncbi:hypothetical protein K502DRAFT_323750 [Neoconidiobolus thromboides FSU 785]|nr:hypothetical protein K502DRAFT_323750 [Neoconidiobolus thromboides FSU 785]